MKHVCQSCSTRYYDMCKKQPTCPKCGVKFDPEALLKSRRARPLPEDKTPSKKPQLPVDVEEEMEELGADIADSDVIVPIDDDVVEEDESVIEDAEELADDVDSVVDVDEEAVEDESH